MLNRPFYYWGYCFYMNLLIRNITNLPVITGIQGETLPIVKSKRQISFPQIQMYLCSTIRNTCIPKKN
ncbi:hypothetical protein D3C87_310420 [compost metagenome]